MMASCMSKRLFIHIPKNGGMSIRRGIPDRILTARRGRHVSMEYTVDLDATMQAAGEHHGFEHARWRDWRADLRMAHRAVAIVRNPWDRVVSRYTFAQVAKDPSGDKTFSEFLEERHLYGGRQFYWHRAIRGWYQQVEYVLDEHGLCQMVDCLRFGTDDYVKYFKLPGRLPVRGASTKRNHDYRKYYGPKEFDIVKNLYQDDIIHFGFDFESGATRNIWEGD